jgi:hypothetical protein
MYAIIEHGGHQYRADQQGTLRLDKMDATPGTPVAGAPTVAETVTPTTVSSATLAPTASLTPRPMTTIDYYTADAATAMALNCWRTAARATPAWR